MEIRMLGRDPPRPERKKAPTIKGRGKLAERLEVEFRPFPLCIALSRMLLGCFAPVLGSSAPKICSFGPVPTSAAAYLGLIPFFNPSLEDCHDAPNSRWPWGSVALPACGRAFARSRRGGGGSGKGCCRRSRTHRIMRPQPVGEGGCPGLGPSSWQSRSISALALRRWGKCAWSLLLSHRLGPMLLIPILRLSDRLLPSRVARWT